MLNKKLVYLAQAETTAGFLSQSKVALSTCKRRDLNQPFIKCVSSFAILRNFARVPQKFKNRVRKSSRTTFVISNKGALRIVKDNTHLKFLKKLKWAYSSSANLSGEIFKKTYAEEKVDIIVEDSRGFFEKLPSTILKINIKKIRKLR